MALVDSVSGIESERFPLALASWSHLVIFSGIIQRVTSEPRVVLSDGRLAEGLAGWRTRCEAKESFFRSGGLLYESPGGNQVDGLPPVSKYTGYGISLQLGWPAVRNL